MVTKSSLSSDGPSASAGSPPPATVLDSFAQAIFTLDDAGHVTYANARALTLVQTLDGASDRETVGAYFWDLVPAPIGRDRAATYRRARESGGPVTFEAPHSVDGWMRVTVHPFDGGLVVTLTDVTAERAQRERMRLLERAVQDVDEAVIITDADVDEPGPRIRYVNAAFTAITGYESHEAMGRSPRFLQGPDTSRETLDRVRRHLEAGEAVPRTEVVNYRKDGTPFWMEWTISPVTSETGKVQHWVAVLRDVTERKQREQERAKERDLLRQTQSLAGGWIVDLRRQESRLTEEARRIHGIGPTEEMNVDRGLSFYPEEERTRIAEAFRRCAEDGEPYDLVLPFITADGRERWVRATGAATYENGEVVRVAGAIQDVTEDHRRREALNRERQRLEMAVQGGELGLWDLNYETGENVVNDRWAEMLGYAPDEVEPTYTYFQSLVHPEDWSVLRRALVRHLTGDAPYVEAEIRMRAADGSWRWILDRGKVLERGDDGRPLRAVGTHVDVTEQRRQREALRAERDLMRRIFDASPAAIVVLNAEGRIVRANERSATVLGVSPDAAEGRFYDDATWEIRTLDGTPLSGDDLPFAQIIDTGKPVTGVEHTIRTPDGRRILSVSGMPLYDAPEGGDDRSPTTATWQDASLRGAVFVIDDVTKERKARQALERSEERFRAVSEEAIDVVAIFAADGTFEYLSPSVEQVIGRSRDELVGTDAFAPVHPEDLGRLRSAFEEVLCGRSETVEVEGRYRRADGSWRTLSIRARQISPAEGVGLPRVLANVRDVTEVRRRRQQLVEAKEQAEEASRLKTAMLANMSHEVRTPLTSIIGFSEVLKDMDVGDTAQRFVRLIHAGGERLLRTLDAVLDLSRLEAGGVSVTREPTSISSLARQVSTDFYSRARERGVDLQVAVSDEPVVVESDAGALEGILRHLVANAIKFTAQGGHVTLCVTRRAGEVVVQVADTGVGMSAAFVPQAFAAFQQESTGDDREFEGSGLGLTIVRRYADLIGASLHIDTEKGHGTTVTMRIPV